MSDEYCVSVGFLILCCRAGKGKMDQRVRELESKREVLCLWSQCLFHGLGYVLYWHGDHLAAMVSKKAGDFRHDLLLALCARNAKDTASREVICNRLIGTFEGK